MSTFNTYPVFESNQVLTSQQLNNLVNYLDQQNRLTRTRLIGVGVVCGLEVTYDAGKKALTITKGTGLTSEGYLLSLGECVTVKYRDYQLPDGTIYGPFVNDANEQDITLYELLTEKADDGPGVTPLADETFLGDKVVLLFLESVDKDLKSCLGKSCDELGKERILTIRKLLISIEDLETVWSRTNTGKPDAIFPEKYDLPIVNIPRVLLNPNEQESSDYIAFSKTYADVLLSVFEDLIKALGKSYEVYRPLLLKSYDEQNPFITGPVADKITAIRNFVENASPIYTPYLGIQYVHDLFNDLVLAYNEFRNSAFELMSECTADRSRFPRHLMLGEATGSGPSPCQTSGYRHQFVQTPIYNHQKHLTKKTISLHNRMVLMLECFDLNRINGNNKEMFPVRITPSYEKSTPLSQRSIPWYYDLKHESAYTSLGFLWDYWHFEVSEKCPNPKDGEVLTYQNQADDQSTIEVKLLTPLYYNIQDYTFFRIEGYINKKAETVLDRINKLKKQFNLPFEVLALQLNPDTNNFKADYRCGFEDIGEDYEMARRQFCGIVDDLKTLYEFLEKNQDIIFNNDEEDWSKILEHFEKLIEMLTTLCSEMSECVMNFDFVSFQNTYKEIVQHVIDLFLTELRFLEKIEIKAGEEDKQIPFINGLLQRLFPFAWKLVDFMFYSRFLKVFYAFKRREYFLVSSAKVFSSFIDKHPGINHEAGVPKGGTFVLVYTDSENDHLFADFSLPYLCCHSWHCVPSCEEGDFELDLPPIARPDYAVTTIDHPVDIDVLLNDYQLFRGDFRIEFEETSEHGGKIVQEHGKAALTYTPPEQYKGTDRFFYSLINEKTGESDKAGVTIVVKSPDTRCYSTDVLYCWGEEAVKETLEIRNINVGPDNDIYQLLLDSLRTTRGFTIKEIRNNVLEDEERRRKLLNCLGIEIPGDATYEDLEKLIVNYQNENCGEAGPQFCYPAEVLQCWGKKDVENILNHRDIPISETPYQQLSDVLTETAGFSDAEIDMLIENGSIYQLLKCLKFDVTPDTPPDQMAEMLKEYQLSNCQGTQ